MLFVPRCCKVRHDLYYAVGEPTIANAMNNESKALEELTLVAGLGANRTESCRIQED